MSDLERFISAQKQSYKTALSEMKKGRKRSHWMWYIFPQIAGLGFSATANYYAIKDLQEAKDYMQDKYLASNLLEITRALLQIESSDPLEVMGYPDNLKLCSSMTLFEVAMPDIPEFGMVIDKFFGGERDERTLELIKAE